MFSLKTFVKVSDAHVKLLSDSTTTVHDINNMHSNKSELCHSITISEISAWAENKNIWITASYIPRKKNYDADTKTRKNKPNWNGCLTKIFLQLPVFVLSQRVCILMLFQYHSGIDPSMHFLPLL